MGLAVAGVQHAAREHGGAAAQVTFSFGAAQRSSKSAAVGKSVIDSDEKSASTSSVTSPASRRDAASGC
jgi:hypothetical protein